MKLQVDANRLRLDIESIAAMNLTAGHGCTRFSYSNEDRRAREYIRAFAARYKLPFATDFAGNIHIRYPAAETGAAPIAFGSHLDTVLHGGMFDGLVGVAASMEILRVLCENSYEPEHPFEMIAFAEEEGSNFGQTMLGSKLLTGKVRLDGLEDLKNPQGESVTSVLDNFFQAGEVVSGQILKEGGLTCFLELHIEQSDRLWREHGQIAIVDKIVGIENDFVRVQGEANHAGAVDMQSRCDALCAASEMVAGICKFARDNENRACVATVGTMQVMPNVPNIIPGQASFSIDFRSDDEQDFGIFQKKLVKLRTFIEKTHHVQIIINKLTKTPVVQMSTQISRVMEDVALEKGLSTRHLYSGAVHDSAILAQIVPTAMIFIPSAEGKSHCPQECTTWEEIACGCGVLMETLLRLDAIL